MYKLVNIYLQKHVLRIDHFDCDNVPLQEVGSHPEYRILSNRLQSLNGSLNDVKLAKSGFFRNSDGQVSNFVDAFKIRYF